MIRKPALKAHPYADIFPLLEGEPFDNLVADIKANGLLHPITIHQDMVLDGRNRLHACQAAGIEPRFVEYNGGDPLSFVLSQNLHRRHLDESQRAMVAARLANLPAHRPSNKAANLPPSQAAAGEKLNVSERTVRSAIVVRDHATSELIKAVDRGDIAVSVAARLAAASEEVQRRAVAEPERAHILVKQTARDERERAMAGKILALPNKKYGVILEDYEWDHETWSEAGKDRHASNHYLTSSDAHTAAEIVKRTEDRFLCAAKHCVLFMWTTQPHLAIAIDVLRLRGFAYKSNAIWDKDRTGTGYWFNNKHEQLLVGVRGDVPCPALGEQWDSLIVAPRGRHSEKPEIFYELIESYFPNTPKIELNARKRRPGWDAWGLEAPDEAAE